MRLGGTAAYLTDITNASEIAEAVAWAKDKGLPIMMIGGGSNIIWDDDGYPGLVMVNKIEGITQTGSYDNGIYLTAGGGVDWDIFVKHSVDLGLTGIEYLSLIPGSVGATPVQNVGAYGHEVSETIVTLQAYDTQSGSIVTLRAGECGFGYRTSIFKTTAKNRYFITAVTFLLQKSEPNGPYYAALQKYFDEHSITEPTRQIVRDAVIAIRSSKLPDPKLIANNGSFFANPITTSEKYFDLTQDYPDIPHWQTENGVKLSAAWLIEQVGFKDHHDTETGMATWHLQPLVLVNENAQTTQQLLSFKQKIVSAVEQQFGIILEQEPELI